MSADLSTTNTAARECAARLRHIAAAGHEYEQELTSLASLLEATLTQQQGGEQEARELLDISTLTILDTELSNAREKVLPQWRAWLVDIRRPIRAALTTAALRTKQPAASEGDVSVPSDWYFRAQEFIARFTSGNSIPRDARAVAVHAGPAIAQEATWLRDRLAVYNPNTSKQAAGEAVPIGWFTDDHLTDRSATTYDKTVADRWVAKGWPITPIYTTPPRHPADEQEAGDAARYRGIKEIIKENRQDCIAPIPEVQNAETFELWVDATITNFHANPERPV